jgi:hypothetical protein
VLQNSSLWGPLAGHTSFSEFCVPPWSFNCVVLNCNGDRLYLQLSSKFSAFMKPHLMPATGPVVSQLNQVSSCKTYMYSILRVISSSHLNIGDIAGRLSLMTEVLRGSLRLYRKLSGQ